MNNLVASFYEIFFNWNTYQELLNNVFDNFDYGKLGWLVLLVPLVLLVLFYKVWEPMRKQRLMWFITLFAIALIVYISTSGILYSNSYMLQYIGNYIDDGYQVNATFFIIKMSLISVLYSLILSGLYSFIIKRFSTNNSHNPF